MFGQRTAQLARDIEWLKEERERHSVAIATLRTRVAELERESVGHAIDASAEIPAPSILVGETRVSLEHAVQALADAHDMATVERHLTLRHHRQGEAHGRAINEW
jgi:hypothetical protein